MKRDLFIESIKALEDQYKYDTKVSIKLGKVFTDAFEANLFPKNDILTSMLIKVLSKENNDTEEWINYFCYELDFGREYKEGSITTKEGNIIDFSTSGKVWDYLNKKENEN